MVEFDKDGVSLTVNIPEAQAHIDPQRSFTFDRVFQPGGSQEEVYEFAGRHVVDDVLNGYYATIFAFGQVGGICCNALCIPFSIFFILFFG